MVEGGGESGAKWGLKMADDEGLGSWMVVALGGEEDEVSIY